MTLTCLALGLSLVACGGSGDSSNAGSAAVLSGIRPDGDGDNPADSDADSEKYPPPSPDGKDKDEDIDNDRATVDSRRYPDGDDEFVLDYGRPAAHAEARLLTGIVKRYYALAAAGKATQACSLLPQGMTREYYELYRPAYLAEDDKTCREIVSRVFAHFRVRLAEPVRVVAVRVKGTTAWVVIGSQVMPASRVTLMRQHGTWRIQEEPIAPPLL
jgi:hypothetical protein